MDEKELIERAGIIDALASKIADDLHLTDADCEFDISKAILEYHNEIDFSDYNAVLEFIEDLFKPLNI
jgi:hypothetical protein